MRTPSRSASPRRAFPLGGMALAGLALLLAAPAVQASGGVVRVTGKTAGVAYKFGRTACTNADTVTFSWDFSAATNVYPSGTSLVAWTTSSSSCPTWPATTDHTQTVSAGVTGTSAAVPLPLFLGTDTCTGSATSAIVPGTANFCIGYALSTAAANTLTEVATAPIQYAMTNPPPPAGVAVVAGDSLLRVSWTAGTDINHYDIYVVEGVLAADAGTADAGTDAGSDAGTDAGSDAGTDAGSDAGADAGSDAGADAGSDAGADAGADAGSDAGTDGGSDAGTATDEFTGASPVVSPTSAGTTIVDHASGGAALENGRHYLVRLKAVDSFTNVSGFTGTYAGTPTPIDDFYSYYQGQGGTAEGGGGCGAAGAGWTAGVLLMAWLAARRRGGSGKGGTALLVFALVTGAAAAAQAEEPAQQSMPAPDPTALGPQFRPLTRSDRVPRVFFFAIKLDRYDPQIDSQPGLVNPNTGGVGTPYHDIFGTRIPLRVQGEASWALLHRPWLGSLLAGGTFGFWQNIGRGRYATTVTDSNGVVVHSKGDVSDDTALLDIWPMGAVATWRLDQLADRYRWFPLVPYAQAGLMTALWASYNGAGKVSKGSAAKPGHGSGWTYGYTAALGVALALDVIDPQLSNEAYVDLGLQRTSLFAEYAWTKLDDFGGGKALVLSDRQWRFGLSLEF